MNNYIVINNQRLELTDEQVELIIAAQSEVVPQILLAEVATGDTCKIGGHEFIVLEQTGDTTVVIRKEPLPDSRFGDTNHYNGSDVDAKCQDFAQEIAKLICLDNIVPHQVDLTSNDGLKDHGTLERCAALLTADSYRRYVDILDSFRPDAWWWLATPFSTAKHDSDCYVLCVSPSGFIRGRHYLNDFGVRPFLILKSNIIVSK